VPLKKAEETMFEKIKYNFWLLVFIGITLFLLYFIYQSISFTSVYAYRWVFFLSTPFLISGIHLLIKSRSNRAEGFSILNFVLTAAMIVYFNTSTEGLESKWTYFAIPVFNQLVINLFDVIWTQQYRFRVISACFILGLWIFSLVSILTNFSWFSTVFLPLAIATGLVVLGTLLFGKKNKKD
jgi:hypothetical protein